MQSVSPADFSPAMLVRPTAADEKDLDMVGCLRNRYAARAAETIVAFNGQPLSFARMRKASMGPGSGRQVYRLIRSVRASRALEVGTCIGIGGAFICAALRRNWLEPGGADPHYIGIECDPEKVRLSLESLECVGSWNWGAGERTVRCGMFEDVLPALVEEQQEFDFIYIDGAHNLEPTWAIFGYALRLMSRGVIVVDDVSRNPGMRTAARRIYSHPRILGSFRLPRAGHKNCYLVGQ